MHAFKNIGIVIQARMGSTRLPGKILMPAKDKSMFQVQIDRLKSIGYPIYIATTTSISDDQIVSFANKNSIPVFRGDENNVLSRYYGCAKEFNLDLIVRLTSDCPLLDTELIKQGIEQYTAAGDYNIYLSNTIERTYPRGFDFEIFSSHLLEQAYEEVIDDFDKEHVTPYIWKNKSGVVKIVQIKNDTDSSNLRITLDTHEDYQLIKILIEEYNADGLNGEGIIKLLNQHPELVSINQHIEQKKT